MRMKNWFRRLPFLETLEKRIVFARPELSDFAIDRVAWVAEAIIRDNDAPRHEVMTEVVVDGQQHVVKETDQHKLRTSLRPFVDDFGVHRLEIRAKDLNAQGIGGRWYTVLDTTFSNTRPVGAIEGDPAAGMVFFAAADADAPNAILNVDLVFTNLDDGRTVTTSTVANLPGHRGAVATPREALAIDGFWSVELFAYDPRSGRRVKAAALEFGNLGPEGYLEYVDGAIYVEAEDPNSPGVPVAVRAYDESGAFAFEFAATATGTTRELPPKFLQPGSEHQLEFRAVDGTTGEEVSLDFVDIANEPPELTFSEQYVTSARQLVLSGNIADDVEGSHAVELRLGGTTLGASTTDGNGDFAIPVTAAIPADGAIVVEVFTRDAPSGEWVALEPIEVTNEAPLLDSIDVDPGFGFSLIGAVSDADDFGGSLAVEFRLWDGTLIGSVSTDAAGEFRFAPPAALLDGELRSISIHVYDALAKAMVNVGEVDLVNEPPQIEAVEFDAENLAAIGSLVDDGEAMSVTVLVDVDGTLHRGVARRGADGTYHFAVPVDDQFGDGGNYSGTVIALDPWNSSLESEAEPFEVIVTEVVEGDFDGNGVVDGGDFLSWQRGLGAKYDDFDLVVWEEAFNDIVPQPLDGDFDGNGVVDGSDFLSWQRGLGAKYDDFDLVIWEEAFAANGDAELGEASVVDSPATTRRAQSLDAALAAMTGNLTSSDNDRPREAGYRRRTKFSRVHLLN